MRAREATKILNCSNSTLANWIRSGKLKLNKVLPNGYRDINEESVYDAIASTYEPDTLANRIIIFKKDGSVLKFLPSDTDTGKIVEYLAHRSSSYSV